MSRGERNILWISIVSHQPCGFLAFGPTHFAREGMVMLCVCVESILLFTLRPQTFSIWISCKSDQFDAIWVFIGVFSVLILEVCTRHVQTLSSYCTNITGSPSLSGAQLSPDHTRMLNDSLSTSSNKPMGPWNKPWKLAQIESVEESTLWFINKLQSVFLPYSVPYTSTFAAHFMKEQLALVVLSH